MRDVAFSCDDHGARFLRVTVWSLLAHYRGSEPLRINVFEGWGGHSPENKRRLGEIVAAFPGATLRYVNVEAAVAPYADLIMNREKSRWNVFTWTPIFTPLLLADATGNVLHLDIDMLVNDDVSKLLELDLGDDLIAAVAEYARGDAVITEAVWGKGILPGEADRYFNTGTILFNAAKCREERTWEKIVGWYREHYDIADRIEQDAWNALYWRRTRLLPLRWNFHDRLVKWYPRWDVAAKYWQGNPPRDCLAAALEPAILHFWGPKKPWKPCHRPYRRLYHAAMRAVGDEPPREEFFAWWHDLANARHRRRIAQRFAALDDAFRYRLKWERRVRAKRLKHLALAPFAWLGIGVALAVFGVAPHRLMQGVCDLVAAVYCRFDREGRRHAEANLAAIRAYGGVPRPLSARETKLIVRRSYRNMVRSVGHAFWTTFFARRRVAAVGEMSPAAKAFLAANRPAVTVSGHLGCWEILSQLAFLEGHRMMSVAKDIGTARMTRLLMRARTSIGQEIVPAKGAFKPLLQGLREGKSLGLLVDQHVSPKKGGVWVRFLGRPMPVSAAPAFFAAKAKAPVIVAWSRPLKDGRYRCEFLAAHASEEARDIWGTTQACARDLEGVIRRHPSCWVLNYNVFKAHPTPEELAELEKREGRR